MAAAMYLLVPASAQLGHDHDGDGIPDHGPEAHRAAPTPDPSPYDGLVVPIGIIVGGVVYMAVQKARRNKVTE